MRTSWLILSVLAISLLGLTALRADEDPTASEPPSGEGTEPEPTARANPVVVIETSLGNIVAELLRDEAPQTVETFLNLSEGRVAFKDLRVDPTGKKLVTRPFYDGLTFHRVMPDFMIQGGCPLATGTGNPIAPFADEINATALGLDKILAFQNGQPHAWLRPSFQSQAHFQQLIVLPLLKKHGVDPTDRAAVQAKAAEMDKELQEMTLKQVYELMGYRYSDTLRARPVTRGVLAMANSGPNTNSSQFFITVGDALWLNGKHTVFGRVIEGLDVADAITKVKRSPTDQPLEPVVILSIRQRAQ